MALGGHEYAITATPVRPSAFRGVYWLRHICATLRHHRQEAQRHLLLWGTPSISRSSEASRSSTTSPSRCSNLGKATVPSSTPITMDGRARGEAGQSLAARWSSRCITMAGRTSPRAGRGAEAAFEKGLPWPRRCCG